MKFAHVTSAMAVAVSTVLLSPGSTAVGKVISHGVHTADWTPKAPPPQYDPTAGPNAVKSRAYMNDVCTTADQLDCVESIGAYLNGSWVDGTPTDTVFTEQRIWTIPGLVNLDGDNRVAVVHQINYTGNIFLTLEIRSAAENGDRDASGLQRNVKFRATIRTSWVLPTHLNTSMSDVKFAVEKLPTSGASRVSMEGLPLVGMVVLDEAQLTSETGKGAYETREFSLGVSDGRFYPIKQDCIEKPALMTSHNSYGVPLPQFQNGNLDLKVTSPHFRSDGTTVHEGIYEAIIPLETAQCLWGDSVSKSSTFKLEVIEQGGVTRTATQSINVSADSVNIKASGFTYSSPTIRVKYIAPQTPTTTVPVSTTTSTTTTTVPPTATTVATTVPAPAPAAPSGVRTSSTKGSVAVSFTKVAGVTYSATATKGKTTKTLRCTSSGSKVSCTAKALAKGSWKITVVPRNTAGTGTSVSKTVRVA